MGKEKMREKIGGIKKSEIGLICCAFQFHSFHPLLAVFFISDAIIFLCADNGTTTKFYAPHFSGATISSTLPKIELFHENDKKYCKE
jgi:hypothetical protein